MGLTRDLRDNWSKIGIGMVSALKPVLSAVEAIQSAIYGPSRPNVRVIQDSACSGIPRTFSGCFQNVSGLQGRLQTVGFHI